MPDKSRSPKLLWREQEVQLNELRFDRDLQPRESLDEATVRRYARCMGEGDVFPPVIVARVRRSLFTLDGHHRVEAAHQAGVKTVSARVAEMQREEAMHYALGTNHAHGKRLTNSDKKRVIMRYLEEEFHLRADGSVKSSRQVEKELNRAVSHATARKYMLAHGVEPGAPEEDGINVRPWSNDEGGEARSEPELLTEMDDYLSAIHLLMDQMEQTESLMIARGQLEAAATQAWQKARCLNGGSLLDI